ncbi:hypothetical protein [Teredinibacter turnerae]|uniref:hypothetical protein n=1 Tax=Teredinibacter turnerae TaxID=2426 RepID=UPI0005F7A3DA|nr:hypothetical protein [Teredinibacter turnerae]
MTDNFHIKISDFLSNHDLNLWSLAFGLFTFLVIFRKCKNAGVKIMDSREKETFEKKERLPYYITKTQFVSSTFLFLAVFIHIPSNTTLSFSLTGILISIYLFFDKNISWAIAKTNRHTNDLIKQVRQLKGIESLPDLSSILIKILSMLESTNSNNENNQEQEVYLICASPAIGAIHENTETLKLSGEYAVAIHTTATKLKERFRVVHYDLESSLNIFAERVGLAETKIEAFLNQAKHISSILTQSGASVKKKVITEKAAEIIFSRGEVPSAMLFHMMIFKRGSESELILWHIDHNYLPKDTGTRSNLSVQGFWTSNLQIVQPFKAQAEQYYNANGAP